MATRVTQVRCKAPTTGRTILMSDRKPLAVWSSRRGWSRPFCVALAVVGLLTGPVLMADLPWRDADRAAHGSGKHDEAASERVPLDEMPSHLAQRSREVLDRAARVGTGRLVVVNAALEHIPTEYIANGSGLYVTFAEPGPRTWKVYVGHSSDTPMVPGCSESPSFVSCSSSSLSDGTALVTSIVALRKLPNTEPVHYQFADVPSLTKDDLGEVRLERNVRAFRPDGSMISVTERIDGPTTLDASAFITPVEDLTILASDSSFTAPSG